MDIYQFIPFVVNKRVKTNKMCLLRETRQLKKLAEDETIPERIFWVD
jgi:hypothetical protein